MSRSVAFFSITRDGQSKCYYEVWGSVQREIIWGPEALESWLLEGEELVEEPEEISGVAFVDFDKKKISWGDDEANVHGMLGHPKIVSAYQQLLVRAWAGFEIKFLAQHEMDNNVRAVFGATDIPKPNELNWKEIDYIEGRPASVAESAEGYGPHDEDDDDEEDPYDEPCAWITIVDQKGKFRHRIISQISSDLLAGSKPAVQEIAKLKRMDVPPETSVREGLWIHLGNKEIGYWNNRPKSKRFEAYRLKNAWKGWKVRNPENGYAQQCQLAGESGELMSTSETLSVILPRLLSTHRSNFGNMVGAIGGSLKKTAIKATGCVTALLALPILLIGFFMNMWKEAGVALIVLVVVVAVVFKFIEYRIRNKFQKSSFAAKDKDMDIRTPTAGPTDESERRKILNDLLVKNQLPTIEEVEDEFPDEMKQLMI